MQKSLFLGRQNQVVPPSVEFWTAARAKWKKREGRRRDGDERKCANQTDKTRPNLNVTP
jgi:hypothetical protein